MFGSAATGVLSIFRVLVWERENIGSNDSCIFQIFTTFIPKLKILMLLENIIVQPLSTRTKKNIILVLHTYYVLLFIKHI